ncbi:MAG: radical SAM protein [Candidatus Omnitrophica bacterium]|jgi:putative pyruvate formate lyase activating enzyme|nr:radical SAM protein [Candidatus Omnitrophota bacterium]
MHPLYIKAYHSGKLKDLAEKTFQLLNNCEICPRKCKVNRIKGEMGFCKTALLPQVCSFIPHHGEEPPISGEHGSGTIFFSHCNMHCVYCQNYEFSQSGEGKEVDFDGLADIMLQLQDMGCHNVNFVTPTHVLPQILKALELAIPKGLKIPLVYNTSGYELPEMIKLLDGIIDVYLPDMRYAQNEPAIKYSAALDYPRYNQEAVREMHRQVGIAKISEDGIIKKGLIIRHLVLPDNLAGTEKIMEFISCELSVDTYISLMSQYFPCYKADRYPELLRRITLEEYQAAQDIMAQYNLYNGWIQESGGLDRFAGINIKPNVR